MIRQSYLCTFILHRPRPGEEPRLHCRVKWEGSRSIVDVSVGFTISPDRWDPEAQLCAPRSFHGKRSIPAATINAEIRRFRDCVDSLFSSYAQAQHWPSVAQLRQDMRSALGIDPGRSAAAPSVSGALTQFLDESAREKAWSPDTVRTLRSFLNRVRESEVFTEWEDFSASGFKRFTAYLQDGLGMSDTTVHKRLGYLRWFCQWALEKGWITDTGWKKFHPKLKMPRKEVTFLEWDEFLRVWNYETKEERLARVRDIFCLCATTSLRYGDAMALTWADVLDGKLAVMTRKSLDPLVIELNPYSSEIIERCRARRSEGEIHVLPHYENQPLNRAIKDLMKAAGVDGLVRVTRYYKGQRSDRIIPKYEAVTCHVARKTFICHALAEGVPPTVVMQWTGHEDYRAMVPYIAVASSTKADAMTSAFRM